MIYKFRLLFNTDRQFRLFGILSMFTLFNFALIAVRLHYIDFNFADIQSTRDLVKLKNTTTFFFLIWNLFLAWIPYWVSLAIEGIYDRFRSYGLVALALFVWLLFFPNAPYLLTDLLHLRSRSPIPFWYDLMLFVSFAWTGMLLGLLSLYEVQRFLRSQFSQTFGWVITIIVIGLSGLGVYIGRFLRWNSWDILIDPIALFQDLLQIMIRPQDFYGSGSIVVISVFLLLSYLAFYHTVESNK